MADIKRYLDAIMKAVKGKDVRASIHDGISAINDETERIIVDVDERHRVFEAEITKQQEDYETEITNRQDVYETNLTNKENAFEEDLNRRFVDNVDGAVNDWLNLHPEATTTVQDGSITEIKLNSELLNKVKNGYIIPQMFGAKGDGVTDDTLAFKQAINYMNEQMSSSNLPYLSDHNPTRIVFGYNLYIPKGVYILSEPLYAPANCRIEGAGSELTFLRFSSDYGISLDGKNYNGLKYYKNGYIGKLTIIMGGKGIGLSNTELSTDETHQNCLQNSNFEDIQIHDCNVGVLIQGAWNNIFNSIVVTVAKFGFIFDNNPHFGGSNNNVFDSLKAYSILQCGFWANSKALVLNNCNIESIGDTWQGTITELSSVIENGTTYTTPKPCGIYITKRPFITINNAWFERFPIITLNEEQVTIPCILIDNIEVINAQPYGSIDIIKNFFNNDCYAPIEVIGDAKMKISDAYYGGTTPLISVNGSTSYGTYLIENIPAWIVRNIVSANKSTSNQFKFLNIRDNGSYGFYDKMVSAKVSNYLVEKYKYEYASNAEYTCTFNKIWETSNKTMYENYNDKYVIGFNYGYGRVVLSNQSGNITVNSGGDSASISFGGAPWVDGLCIILTANSEAGARMIKDGYYISNKTATGFTVKFLSQATEDCTFGYMTMSKN